MTRLHVDMSSPILENLSLGATEKGDGCCISRESIKLLTNIWTEDLPGESIFREVFLHP